MDVHDMHREQIRKEGERAERKAKIKFTVKWFGIGLIIGFVATWLTSCGVVSETPEAQETTATESIQETVTESVPETGETMTASEAVTENAPVQETETAHEAPAATWHASTKSHDITVDSILAYGDDMALWNFSDCTAVGAGITSHVIVPAEADYGFIVTVIDNDTVEVKPYNNSTEHIVPVKVTAELSTGDVKTTESYESYTITGYNGCTDGFGTITVGFSDGYEMNAGVFKENGRLYAVNINKQSAATGAVDRRLVLAKLMADAGITEADCISTDPIYYPIVAVAKGEAMDTAYWVKKSAEITQPDWTDAHKIMAFYNYVIDNFAYDNWVVAQGDHARCFLYNDYTGKYYISNTNVGVCEDFSQVIAIMCRAQGIPSLVFSNDKHSVTVAYIKDYNRWLLIDSTADIENDVYQEDYTVWVKTEKLRYKHFGYTTATGFNVIAIGNEVDMKKYDIPMFQ